MFKQVIKTLCLRSVWITGNRLVVVNHMNLWSTHWSGCTACNLLHKQLVSRKEKGVVDRKVGTRILHLAVWFDPQGKGGEKGFK